MNNKKMYIIILSIVFLIAGVLAVTFGFIGKGNETGSTNVLIDIYDVKEDIDFGYSGDVNLSLSINRDNLSSVSASNDYTSFIDSESKTVTIELTSAEAFKNGAKCTYEVLYIPSSVYTQSAAAKTFLLNELVVSGSVDNNDFADVSISGPGNKLIYNGTIETYEENSPVTQEISLKLRFYNLLVDQESAIGQSAGGTIKVGNIYCEGN